MELAREVEKVRDSAGGQAAFPILSSAIASILTGTALVVVRYIVPQTDGLSVATLRYLLATGCLLFLVPICDRLIVDKRDLPPIIVPGVLYYGLMVLAAVSGGIYAVYSKPYVIKYSPLTVTSIAMGAGAIALSLIWFIGDRAVGLPHFDLFGWLAISYIGIAGEAVSFFLYAWALGRASPTTIMILLPLNPIAALIAGSLWLGEPFGVGIFIGLALVIAGVLLVVAPNRSTPPGWPSWGGNRK
jgi:uncharacterized membrane protein